VTNAVTIVAGGGTGTCTGAKDALGDGCLAAQATLKNPYGARFYKGDMYIADAGNNYIRKVDGVTGIISVYAGNKTSTSAPVNGAAATATAIANPQALGFDSAGNLYVVGVNEVYLTKISSSTSPVLHPVTILAGTGTSGTAGDGGLAINAQVNAPGGIAVDAQGNIYMGTSAACTVRKITAATGMINTYAGIAGTCGFSGDGGLATSAEMNAPFHISLDGADNLYIADSKNSRIREVLAATGTIMTIAGNGTAAEAGDGGPALSASFNVPKGLYLTNGGSIVIAGYRQRDHPYDSADSELCSDCGWFHGDADGLPSSELCLDGGQLRCTVVRHCGFQCRLAHRHRRNLCTSRNHLHGGDDLSADCGRHAKRSSHF
jgi:hypothetical protein